MYGEVLADIEVLEDLKNPQTVAANNPPCVVGTTPTQVRRKPAYGCAKDKIWIADDFDAPLDDFKGYM